MMKKKPGIRIKVSCLLCCVVYTTAGLSQVRGEWPDPAVAARERVYTADPDFRWQLHSGGILPQWRDGIATVSRGHQLYLIAGWHPGAFSPPFTATTNEIWRSSDNGVTWTFFCHAGFSPRHTFVCIDSPDGYVYVIGGDQYNNPKERSEVWRSTDLAHWELVSQSAPFGNRMQMAGVEYNGDFYIGGGQRLPDFSTGFTDMYVSRDKGMTWTLLGDTLTHMGKNMVGTLCVYNNRIYQVSGGWYGGDQLRAFTYSQAVFSTADGVNWRKENSLPVPGVQYPNTVVYDKKLWLIGGSSVVTGLRADHYNKNTMCFMDPDGTWHVAGDSAADPKTHASSLVVHGKALLMVTGNQLNDVYQLVRK